MEKYLVIDERINGDGDQFVKVFNAPELAEVEAERQWNYLTAREQKTRHIYTAVVTESDLAFWAVDDETGEIDWTAFDSCDTYEGAFDSAAAKEVIE